MAVESGRVPLAHVLSPERRALRAQLAVRGSLMETRAPYITSIRGLARAGGVMLPTWRTENFTDKLETATVNDTLRELIAPLVAVLKALEVELARVEATLAGLAERDPIIGLCATVPGVGLIVAATFVSVLDEAKRFRNAHAVGAYLGLVPGESTRGGPSKRRLGGITEQGNTIARAMLVQAAWHILRMRDADDPLRRWADNIALKRGKRIAVVALARKLAGVLWAMWRDGTVYDRAINASASAVGVRREARKQTRRAEVLQKAAAKLRRAAAPAGHKASEAAGM